MIREIPDMFKKILKEMENQLKISQEKGWWKRKDKKSSIFEPRSSVIEEFVSLSLNSSIGKLFGAAASCHWGQFEMPECYQLSPHFVRTEMTHSNQTGSLSPLLPNLQLILRDGVGNIGEETPSFSNKSYLLGLEDH